MTYTIRQAASAWLLAALITAFGASSVQAQEFDQLGGPYEPDSATVLLMHFDSETPWEPGTPLVNEADSSADGSGYGELSFVQDPFMADFGLGSHLQINNSSPDFASYVTVPDTAALDLTGSWTIEVWVYITTFGTTGDHRNQPRIINKPGTPWYQANYWVYARGGENSQNYWTGFREDVGGGSYPEVISPQGSLVTGEWRHFAFIRDAERGVIVQVISEPVDTDGDGAADELEFRHFESQSFDLIGQHPPTTNDKPLYIGRADTVNNTFFLDGFVDEVRISNVVRPFELPPLLRGITTYDQPFASEGPYAIEAEASTLLGDEVESVRLHWRADTAGAFTEEPMTLLEGDTYTASIPGQPINTTVQYYVSTSVGEHRVVDPVEAEEADPQYYSFTTTGAIEPNTLALALDFEEGPGSIPQDQTGLGHEVRMVGEAAYSEDAYSGDYALALDGDSSWIEITSPYQLSFDSLRVEMWFKPDTVQTSLARLISNPSATWFQPNFQIYFASGSNQLTAGSYFPDVLFENGEGGTPYLNNVMPSPSDTMLAAEQWYQAVYELSSDSALFQVLDAELNVLQDTSIFLQGGEPIEAVGPLKIGSEDNRFFFRGKVDEVKIYNYPQTLPRSTGTAVDEAEGLPERVTLSPNYPNPFNPTTTIVYALPAASEVTLSVYDVLGREVARLVDGERRGAGQHRAIFEASGLGSGVYFYQLEVGQTRQVKRMVLLK